MKICCLKTCLSLAVGCFLPLVSYADSIYRVVPDEASKSIPGWENASTDLKGTIEGVNVAGSTVLVMNGHYNIGEQITFKNATAGSLTIRSVNPATGETDFGGAIFDAKKDNPGNEVRLFAAEREIAFYGCQLVNGRVDGNGGAALGKICAYDCVISNNTASGDGGAVGSTWGGVCAGVFSNCLFACNQAKKQYAGGGAFFTFSGSPTFYDCVFSNNTVNAGSGAAVYVKQGCEDLAIERCTFVENDGTDDLCGAVVFVGDGVAVARPVTDCRFAGNRGISLSGAQTPLLRCEFAQNMCDQPFATKALVESCIITNNTCSFFSCNKAIVSNLRNCLVADNRFNAAIFRMHSSYPAICRISNCTFTKNTASYSYSLYDSPNENQGVSMTNTVFYDNAISKTFDSKTFDSLVGCMSEEHAGLAYKNLQRVILQMQRQGVLLVIVSKNNEEDAMELIRNHPHMVLREDAFAARRINWRNKDENLRELAEELNLGLDSFVFFDDDPKERMLVQTALPQVAVPDFAERVEDLTVVMTAIFREYFAKAVHTEEDGEKTRQYADNAKRLSMQEAAGSFEDYLKNLQIEITRVRADEHSNRVTELLNKTNQFNLTTVRHEAAEVAAILQNPKKRVFAYRVKDCFGDNGVVAVLIVDVADTPVIEEFVMSCRVMGRNVERGLIGHVSKCLVKEGFGVLRGIYLPTAKNKPVESLYEQLGFALKETGEDGAKYYEKALGQDEYNGFIGRMSE